MLRGSPVDQTLKGHCDVLRAKGQIFEDRYRTFSQDVVVETMLLEGYACSEDLAAARGEAREAISRFSRAGLGFRTCNGENLYDPVEVACFVKAAALEGDDYWERRYVATLRQFVTDLASLAPRRASLVYRRHFDAANMTPGETRRLRLPLPLVNRHAGVDIVPELPVTAISHRMSDGRLEARVAVGDEAEIAIGAQIELDLGQPAGDAPPEGDLYLRSREGWIVITPAVTELAGRLASAGARQADAVRAFWEYLIETFIFCPIHYDAVPVETPLDWVLEHRVYDCQLASALFCALCRTHGIMARMVGGNFLYRRSPTNHYWAEVWNDDNGWTPVDFIGWDLSRGGRDNEWRDRFFGQTDARLVTECLPQSFTGAIGVNIPDAWVMVRTISGDGVEMRLSGLDGTNVYRDRVSLIYRGE